MAERIVARTPRGYNQSEVDQGRFIRRWIVRAYTRAAELHVEPLTKEGMARAIGVSPRQIGRHMTILAKMGVLERGAGNRLYLAAAPERIAA